MTSCLSSPATYLVSRLWALAPGTIAGTPDPPPLRASARWSRRRPCNWSFEPWHVQQRDSRIGRTSCAKSGFGWACALDTSTTAASMRLVTELFYRDRYIVDVRQA